MQHTREDADEVYSIGGSGCGSITRIDYGMWRGRRDDEDGTLIVEVTTKSYEEDVQPVIQNICIACHFSFVPAFVLTGNAQTDYTAVSERISTDNPEDSKLLKKPSGQTSHEGGTVLPVGSDDYNTILEWISGGGSE